MASYPIRVIEVNGDETDEEGDGSAGYGSPQIINDSPDPPRDLYGGIDLRKDETNGAEGHASGLPSDHQCVSGNQSMKYDVTNDKVRDHRSSSGNQIQCCTNQAYQKCSNGQQIESRDNVGPNSRSLSDNDRSIDSVTAKSKKERKKCSNSGPSNDHSSSQTSCNCLKGNPDGHDSESEGYDQPGDLESTHKSIRESTRETSSSDWQSSSECYTRIDRKKRRISESSVREALKRIEDDKRREAENLGFVLIETRDAPDVDHCFTQSEKVRRKRGICNVL